MKWQPCLGSLAKAIQSEVSPPITKVSRKFSPLNFQTETCVKHQTSDTCRMKFTTFLHNTYWWPFAWEYPQLYLMLLPFHSKGWGVEGFKICFYINKFPFSPSISSPTLDLLHSTLCFTPSCRLTSDGLVSSVVNSSAYRSWVLCCFTVGQRVDLWRPTL